MKQGILKIKKCIPKTNIINDGDFGRKILNIMLCSLGALAFCYVLILGNIIFNIVERKSLETDMRSIVNEVGGLESQYLSIFNKIDLSLAQSMGFKEIKDKQYAVRKYIGTVAFIKNEL